MSARWLDTSDADAWRAALPASRSAFGSLEFARAIERSGGPPGALLVVEAGGAELAWPFQLRTLDDLPFASSAPAGVRGDVATPPFTGPYAAHEPSDEQLAALGPELDVGFAQHGLVADFTHLHPFAAERRAVPEPVADREVVWVDTTLDPERLWRDSYSKACRKNVNRAAREGVSVRPAASEADIAEFHRIYLQTMERTGALAGYFYPVQRFLAIFHEMPANARFALVEHGGRVIAATLYLHDDEDVYSFLGGADREYQQLRPTNAMVHDTIGWAREQGKRRLILGGGYRLGDGIFRFKASFSPLRATLELERRVRMPAEYDALLRAWNDHHGAHADPAGYFPAYRADPK